MSGPVTRSQLRRAVADLNYLLVPSFDEAASPEALRRVLDASLASYRRLVKIHHPDQGGSAHEFIRITRARDVVNLASDKFLPSLLPQRRMVRGMSIDRIIFRMRINGVEIDVSNVSFSES